MKGYEASLVARMKRVNPALAVPLVAPRSLPSLVAAALLLTGCAMFGPEAVLRQQMNTLHACPDDQMKITSLGGSRYQVDGCGSSEIFVCGQTHGWVCNR